MVLNRNGWVKILTTLLNRDPKWNNNNGIIKWKCPEAWHLNLNGSFRRNLETECSNEEVKQVSGDGSDYKSNNIAPSDLDPIQMLFVEKIREYAQKSKANGGNLVDPTAEIKLEWERLLHMAAQSYGLNVNDDLSNFPKFEFKEVVQDGINLIGKTTNKK